MMEVMVVMQEVAVMEVVMVMEVMMMEGGDDDVGVVVEVVGGDGDGGDGDGGW